MMFNAGTKTLAKSVTTAAVLFVALVLGVGVMLPAQPAYAVDLATAKATVDAAKVGGIVGEQGDGYLGFVHGSADSATMAAVEAINAGRKQAYVAAAAKTGVSPEAAGEATAKQLFAVMPSGQYYKAIGGGWMRK